MSIYTYRTNERNASKYHIYRYSQWLISTNGQCNLETHTWDKIVSGILTACLIRQLVAIVCAVFNTFIFLLFLYKRQVLTQTHTQQVLSVSQFQLIITYTRYLCLFFDYSHFECTANVEQWLMLNSGVSKYYCKVVGKLTMMLVIFNPFLTFIRSL